MWKAGSNAMKSNRKSKGKYFLISALLTAVIFAFIVSPFASKAPDGLEKVAGEYGFMEREISLLHGSPLADYIFPGIKNTAFAKGLAGVIGTTLVFGLGFLFVYAVKKTGKNKNHASRRESDFS